MPKGEGGGDPGDPFGGGDPGDPQQQGAAMATFDNIDTIFNASLTEALRPGGYFPEGSFMQYNLSGNKTLNLPINSTRIADNLADITNQLTPPTESIAKVTLSNDDPLKAQSWISDEDIEDHGMSIVTEYANSIAMDIMEGEAHRMSALLIKAAIDNDQVTLLDTAQGTDTLRDYFARQQHAIDLSLQSIRSRQVRGTLSGLIKPTLFTPSTKSDWSASLDFGKNAMTGFNQRRVSVSNAQLFEENSVFDFDWGATPDTTKPANLTAKYGEDFAGLKILGVVWSNEALAIGRGAKPTVEKDRHVDRSAWQYVARSRFGTAMKFTEGCHVIIGTGGSFAGTPEHTL